MRCTVLCVATLSYLLLASCATEPGDRPPASAPDFGFTKANPIEVCRPEGQRAYLSSLLCPGGASPQFRRVGNVGERTPPPPNQSEKEVMAQVERMLAQAPLRPGEPDYHVIDAYEVACGPMKQTLFLDMCHCHQPAPIQAPRGFGKR
jgi:hypothetical protein